MSRTRRHPWQSEPPDGGRPVVVGVEPGRAAAVLPEAARLARALGGGLLAVWVDGSRVVVGHDDAGDLVTTPLDPDADDPQGPLPSEQEVHDEVAAALRGADVPWRFVYTVGDVARGLAAVAEDVDAALLVVGARRRGLTGWMTELVGGSVAGRLAHTQHRPVTVIPAGPA